MDTHFYVEPPVEPREMVLLEMTLEERTRIVHEIASLKTRCGIEHDSMLENLYHVLNTSIAHRDIKKVLVFGDKYLACEDD